MISPFLRHAVTAVVLLTGVHGVASAGQDARQNSLVGLSALDQRVATIGHRLAVASRDLCADRQWLPGVALHDLSQYGADYRAAAVRAFGLDSGPAVLAVAENGPAARAGLRANDVVLRVDGSALPRDDAGPEGSFETVERILDALDRAFADGEAALLVRRDGATQTVPVRAEQGCTTRFQVLPSRRLNALADGRYVQVTAAIGGYVADDQELAAVLAHEFAHNVLRHRARLDAAGVRRGFLGNFGRNARLIRDTEAEADRLSIYLLDRAGYDVEAPIRFWSRFGRRGLNFLGSPTHPNWRRRIALFQSEIDVVRLARASGRMPIPDFLRAVLPPEP